MFLVLRLVCALVFFALDSLCPRGAKLQPTCSLHSTKPSQQLNIAMKAVEGFQFNLWLHAKG